MRNLTSEELQFIAHTGARLHMAHEEESFTAHSYSVLRTLFSHEHLTSEHFNVSPFRPMEQIAPTIDMETVAPIAMQHVHEHPYYPRMATKMEADISTTESERTYDQFRTSTLLNEVYTPMAGSSQMWIGLRDEDDLLINMFYRNEPYSQTEITMLSLIQPHLETAWKNWKKMRSFRTELSILQEAVFQTPEEEQEAFRIRKRIDALPPRQREVVEMIADGLDNQQIADGLGISPLTVKRHLQMIFQALDVQHRTQLAAQWYKAHCVKLY